MKYYESRIRTVLNVLKDACRTEYLEAEQIRYRSCGYEMDSVMKEEISGWKIFEKGDTWGSEDGHACFALSFQIPPIYRDRPVWMEVLTNLDNYWNTDNPQFLVNIDGRNRCGLDVNHRTCRISPRAEAGQRYDVRLYAYQNHAHSDVSLKVTFYVLREDVQKLFYDLLVPFEAAVLLPEDGYERQHMLMLLNETLNCLDLRRVGSEQFYSSVKEAEAYLQARYDKLCCPQPAVTEYCIGHTHIDVAWKWPLRQTVEKAVRSFYTVLELMDQYSEYRFMSSQPQLYEFVKEEDPDLYAQIKAAVKAGRWEPEGGMWLEPDCNLINGESMVRQLLYGRSFFWREFGVRCEILWLPDVFGYSASMPQILKKSGIRYFMTTKISWNEVNRIPNDTMVWRGIDGTGILTYFITTQENKKTPGEDPDDFTTTYNGEITPSQVSGCWERYSNKGMNQDILNCFGFGDGGGGATADMLEQHARLKKGITGIPRTKQGFAKEFFHRLEHNLKDRDVPEWSGELYLEFHRGTYTSMGRNKRYNRLCEWKNCDVEQFSVLGRLLRTGLLYPREDLNRCWKLTLLNQFHDILPGSSIKEVYEDSKTQYEEILRTDRQNIEKALRAVADRIPASGRSAVVFNPLYTAGEGMIRIDSNVPVSLRRDGAVYPGQPAEDGGYLFWVDGILPKGYGVFSVEPASAGTDKTPVKAEDGVIDTPYYRIRLNEQGYPDSIYDKEAGRELVQQGKCVNELQIFEDRPSQYDNWNLDASYREKMWGARLQTGPEVVETGPVRTCIRTVRHFLDSRIQQDMIVYPKSRRIDFVTDVDWRESQLFLKAAFPLEITAGCAVYDIQFGSLERPTHTNTSWEQAKFEVCAHKWADLSEYGYGAAVLNDCKYGYDIHGSVIRLSLLKSGIYPNPDADKEKHRFTYSLYPHMGGYREGKVIEKAYELNCPLYAVLTGPHAGSLPASYSMISADRENIVIENVKEAEDSQRIVIRTYEAWGKRTAVRFRIAEEMGERVFDASLMEEEEQQIECVNHMFTAEYGPYEIKTFLIGEQ